jgi:hypothetical protein
MREVVRAGTGNAVLDQAQGWRWWARRGQPRMPRALGPRSRLGKGEGQTDGSAHDRIMAALRAGVGDPRSILQRGTQDRTRPFRFALRSPAHSGDTLPADRRQPRHEFPSRGVTRRATFTSTSTGSSMSSRMGDGSELLRWSGPFGPWSGTGSSGNSRAGTPPPPGQPRSSSTPLVRAKRHCASSIRTRRLERGFATAFPPVRPPSPP